MIRQSDVPAGHGRRRPPLPRDPRAAPAAVSPLAVVGTLLLGASTTLELSNADPHAELWVAVAAGSTFLLATALRRGSGGRLLAVRGRLIGGAGLSALLAVAALWQSTDRATPRVLLLLIPVFLLFTTAALALREAGVEQRRARLREVESRLDGEEWERRRWVRELHDDTLQELAAVHVLLAGAAAGDAAARERAIADAGRMVGQQIQTLRRLISRMRPLALDSLGLGAALEDLARHAQAGNTEIDVDVDGMPRMPAETETHIYRIAQEALTNAVRHAGARRITIEARPHSQVEPRPHGQIESRLRRGVESRPHGQVEPRPHGQIESRLRGQIESWLRGQIESRLRGQIESWLRGQIESWLRGGVESRPRGGVELEPAAGSVTVTVRDDGRGLPVSGFVAGHGLLGMRERADILGATLEITNPASGGTVVRLRVPRCRTEP